jgi:hypothetical protein
MSSVTAKIREWLRLDKEVLASPTRAKRPREAQRSRLAGLALRPEPRPKPEGRQRASTREAMEPRRTEFDLQGQHFVGTSQRTKSGRSCYWTGSQRS